MLQVRSQRIERHGSNPLRKRLDGALTSALLGAVQSGALAGLVTTVTLAELLTQPARAGDRRAIVPNDLRWRGRVMRPELILMDDYWRD
jgi:hypothetical protein